MASAGRMDDRDILFLWEKQPEIIMCGRIHQQTTQKFNKITESNNQMLSFLLLRRKPFSFYAHVLAPSSAQDRIRNVKKKKKKEKIIKM